MIIQLTGRILKGHQKARLSLYLLGALCLMALYAPLIANVEPFISFEHQTLSFPLIKHLFSKQSYPFYLDRVLNLGALFMPFFFVWKRWRKCLFFFSALFFLSALSTLKSGAFIEKAPGEKKYCLYPPITHFANQMVWETSQNSSFLQQTSLGGENLIAKLLFAMRYSFSLAFFSSLLTLALGIFWGALSSYLGGLLDQVLSRLLEVWDSMPTLLIVLMAVQWLDHPGFFLKSLLLALLSWTSIAKIVRLEILKNKCLPYVDVLKNLECSHLEIGLKHLLPSALAQVLVIFPFILMGTLLVESTLSFMGLGAIERSSLGQLIDEARMSYPLDLSLFGPPAFVLLAAFMGLIFLGDALKRELLPNLKEKTF